MEVPSYNCLARTSLLADMSISSSADNSMLLDGVFSDDISFWPRSISCDLLSLPTGGATNILVRLPPANMLDLFKRSTGSWRIAEVQRTGEDPAAAILSNQGNSLLLQLLVPDELVIELYSVRVWL